MEEKSNQQKINDPGKFIISKNILQNLKPFKENSFSNPLKEENGCMKKKFLKGQNDFERNATALIFAPERWQSGLMRRS